MQALAAIRFTVCGLRQDGTIWCWGDNRAGAVGNGNITNQVLPTPVLGGIRDWAVVGGGAGAGHFCAVRSTGLLYCWGENQDGQLGLGTTTDGLAPQEVLPPSPGTGCVSPSGSAGELRYDTPSKLLKFCDGRLWLATDSLPSTCTGGCVDPAGAEGDVRYDRRVSALTFCNADCWVTVGVP
jgi:hypothetical protein